MNRVTCIRLLIADDQPRARQSLEALLTAVRWSTSGDPAIAIEIVGEAESGRQVVEQVHALLPDVVVMDLPTHASACHASGAGAKPEGLTAIRTIKSRWPTVRIVVLTLYASDRAAVLLAGADAFLLKGCLLSDLLKEVAPGAP